MRLRDAKTIICRDLFLCYICPVDRTYGGRKLTRCDADAQEMERWRCCGARRTYAHHLRRAAPDGEALYRKRTQRPHAPNDGVGKRGIRSADRLEKCEVGEPGAFFWCFGSIDAA